MKETIHEQLLNLARLGHTRNQLPVRLGLTDQQVHDLLCELRDKVDLSTPGWVMLQRDFRVAWTRAGERVAQATIDLMNAEQEVKDLLTPTVWPVAS